MARNPPWDYDEIVLALDLYDRRGQAGPSDPEVRELSEILNRLPIHAERGDAGTFRNPTGVAMKLGNLARFDESYGGVGLTRGGRREEEVWDRFDGRRDELRAAAAEIRQRVDADEVPTTPEDDEEEVIEGRVLFRRHRARERNRRLVARKKQSVLEAEGRLACEVCDVDFGEVYGDLGEGFIECHHRLPLHESSGTRRTKLDDLALVCPNCHRVLHRTKSFLTVEQLRSRVLARGGDHSD